MTDPPKRHPGDEVMIRLYLRPKLAAFIHLLSEPLGLTEAQLIARLLDDYAQRGATANAKRHSILVRRRELPAPRPRKPALKEAAANDADQ